MAVFEMIDLSEIFSVRNIVIYFAVINVVAFLAMWIDKVKAKRGSWRIKEATLFTFVLLGGGFGGIAGMYAFRHKTKKLYFTVGFPVILICELVFFFYFVIKFG